MTAEPTLEKTATNGIRTALGLGGALSVILGIVILVWPGKTAMVVTAIIAIYAIVAGLVYAGMGIFATGKGGWSRVGHVLLGVLYVVAGIVAFSNLGLAALSLAVFLGILVGIMWVIEGVVALSTLDLAPSRGGRSSTRSSRSSPVSRCSSRRCGAPSCCGGSSESPRSSWASSRSDAPSRSASDTTRSAPLAERQWGASSLRMP
jgi:uncharacterized membrane protein HdeD (DUF308 family)